MIMKFTKAALLLTGIALACSVQASQEFILTEQFTDGYRFSINFTSQQTSSSDRVQFNTNEDKIISYNVGFLGSIQEWVDNDNGLSIYGVGGQLHKDPLLNYGGISIGAQYPGNQFQAGEGYQFQVNFNNNALTQEIFTIHNSIYTYLHTYSSQDIFFYSLTPVSAPAVPEPEEWAMMVVGFPLVGWQIRRKKGQRRNNGTPRIAPNGQKEQNP